MQYHTVPKAVPLIYNYAILYYWY